MGLRYKLFEFFSKEHDLTLTDVQIDDIVFKVEEYQKERKEYLSIEDSNCNLSDVICQVCLVKDSTCPNYRFKSDECTTTEKCQYKGKLAV